MAAQLNAAAGEKVTYDFSPEAEASHQPAEAHP
jgi:hypothetical protein